MSTKAELLAEAKRRGVEVDADATKAEIEQALDADDADAVIGAGVDAPEQTDSAPEVGGPESRGIIAARPGDPEAERMDPPANEYDVGGIHEGEPRRDPASGAIITGEDERGRALTTEAVAAGAEPVSPGFRQREDAKVAE